MTSVVLFLIDGLRPDAISPEHSPAIAALMKRGAWTLSARSTMPSITLPCHQTIFHSVPPEVHGVTNNENPIVPAAPGLVEVLRDAKRRSAIYHNWEPLRNLNRPEYLDHCYFRDNGTDPEGDMHIAQQAARLIPELKPDFAFVYLGCVDMAGHFFGWMSDGYLDQVQRTDKAVKVVLDVLPQDAVVILQSDHGGHDRTHGTDMPEDMTIPWIVAGPGIPRNRQITEEVSLLDTAPTITEMLGVRSSEIWYGRSVIKRRVS